MSKTEFSFKNNIKIQKEEDIEEFDEKPYQLNNSKNQEKENNNNINNNENNDNNNNLNNDKNNSNKNNYSFNESNPNYSTSRECLNYFLSYYYEQDFSLEEKDEPKNAGFFARIFGNHPKIYPILPELKSERDFIIFLKKKILTDENNMFDKIFGKIINFIENTICDIDIDEDKILKKKNPSNIIKKSNKLLKEKMKSFIEIEIHNKTNKNLFQEFDINKLPTLMALQLLSIIEKFPNFIETFVNVCFPNEKEIILAFSFYLSSIAFDRLLSGRLNIFFNRNKLVLDDYQDFYLGLFEYTYELFESNKYMEQEKFSKIQSEAENMPSSILWKAKNLKIKFPEINSDSSLSNYFNNSSMNQK